MWPRDDVRRFWARRSFGVLTVNGCTSKRLKFTEPYSGKVNFAVCYVKFKIKLRKKSLLAGKMPTGTCAAA